MFLLRAAKNIQPMCWSECGDLKGFDVFMLNCPCQKLKNRIAYPLLRVICPLMRTRDPRKSKPEVFSYMDNERRELPVLRIGKHQPRYPIVQGGMGVMVSGPRLAGTVA